MSRIGIFDSGLGGYHILTKIKEAYPTQDIVFLADQKNVPYGNKSREELLNIYAEVMNFFRKKRIKTVIIACNTLSSLHLKEEDIRTINMIDITSAAVKDPKVLVLSTVFTANHHAYKEALPGKEVIEVGFEHLASLIEAQASKEEICKELDSKLSSYYHSGIPAVLACTHYPLVEDEIKDYLQAKTYDSVGPVLSLDIYTKGKGKVEVFASIDPEKFDEKVADIFHEQIHTGKAE